MTSAPGIDVRKGDLFESSAQTLVNTVNTVGVMGKGVALGFKQRFPEMYRDYVQRCELGLVKLGEPYLWQPLVEPWVLNFPTKGHWRKPSRLEDIVSGLEYLQAHYRAWGVTSLAVPPLGCGYGGLEWRVVGPTLYEHLSRLDIPIELYAPFATPHEQLTPDYLAARRDSSAVRPEHEPASKVPPAFVGLVAVLARMEQDPYHWPVGSTTFQKLAYFGTVAGLPTSLTFTRAPYGPFAHGLRSIATQLLNNGLLRQERLGRMNAFKVGPTFEAAQRAYGSELERWQNVVDRLADLLARMRTGDAELAASVHFAAQLLMRQLDRTPTEGEVMEYVLDWKKDRDRPPTPEEVADAVRNLGVLGWLHLTPTPGLPVPDLTSELVRTQ
jgi:O-acetyl-ADP-ribose deacetylase (regulator of RNase III)